MEKMGTWAIKITLQITRGRGRSRWALKRQSSALAIWDGIPNTWRRSNRKRADT